MRRPPTTRVRAAIATVLAAAVGLTATAGCGSDDGGGGPAPAAVRRPTTTAAPATTSTTVDPHASFMAFSAGPQITAYDGPDLAAPSHVVNVRPGAADPRIVMRVHEDRGDWLKVQLPERPNGRTGWVPRDGVELGYTRLRVRVELGAHRIVVTDAGRPVLEGTVAIGAPQWPTPTGSFYVTEILAAANPRGAYGPYAFALAAYSDVFTEFAGGPGQVAIHGTNRPDLLGTAASHGCVRMANADITAMTKLVPVGTPVDVVA